MDKRETVVESIQKLLALNVSDQEIAENLYDVGIGKEEAMSMIKEAKKGNQPASTQGSVQQSGVVQQKASQDVFEETVSDLSMNEQIVNQLPIDKKVSNQVTGSKSSVVKEVPKENLAEKIMIDVSQQGDEEDIEDEVEETLKSVNQGASEEKVSQEQDIIQTPQEAPLQQKPVQKPVQVSQPKKTEIPVQKQSFTPISPVEFNSSSLDFQKLKSSAESSPAFEELWKKGIVVAVNAKLAEMKHLKDDIDSELQVKVDESIRKELYQFKILIDSQKDLMVSSNKEALEQKQKEIVFIIDAKIAELKQYNRQLSENLAAIESARKQQELALQQINQALSEARKTKAQMIVEMNSEMIKTKSQAQEFLDQASGQINQMDERINKTLELEKNIAEGMLAQAEQKIETLAIQRADDLIANLEVELNRLQSISKKISPEMLDQKIQVLEEFKKQFLTSMQQNLTQINSAIDELNQKNIIAERTLQEKSLVIDAKIEELTKFEKQFTERISKMLK
ncbi:MAG: hypothetical protein WC462_00465 [archaeon]